MTTNDPIRVTTDDPFRSPPGTNPPRHVPPEGSGVIGWTLGAAAVLVALGLAVYGMSGRIHTTAVDPPTVIGIPPTAPAPTAKAPAPTPETIGRGDHAPATPLPFNPNRTLPQVDPSSPTHQVR